MLDASGKFGFEGGLFDGNMAAFGDFDECLRVDVTEYNTIIYGKNVTIPTFKGQYTTNKFSLVPLSPTRCVISYFKFKFSLKYLIFLLI